MGEIVGNGVKNPYVLTSEPTKLPLLTVVSRTHRRKYIYIYISIFKIKVLQINTIYIYINDFYFEVCVCIKAGYDPHLN